MLACGGGRDGGGSTGGWRRGGPGSKPRRLLRFFKVKGAVIKMIMIEFSIPDCNETFSNTERREVVFRTQWFIGQYCNEREGRGYRCRCTSVPLSLYFISILCLHSTDDRKRDVFFIFQTIAGAQVWFLLYFSTLSRFFSYF